MQVNGRFVAASTHTHATAINNSKAAERRRERLRVECGAGEDARRRAHTESSHAERRGGQSYECVDQMAATTC